MNTAAIILSRQRGWRFQRQVRAELPAQVQQAAQVRVPRRQVQLELLAVRTLAARHPVRSISLRSVWREDSLTVINSCMIPALDKVGKGFEAGTVFLPQLLMSAEAAKSAFEVIKNQMESSGEAGEKKDKIVLATVKGDIHDIGKNIVKYYWRITAMMCWI